MEINLNDPNISSTLNVTDDENKWSFNDIYKSQCSIDQYIDVLKVTDVLKKEYPNDETITDFEFIIRNEICNMFGGILPDEMEL